MGFTSRRSGRAWMHASRSSRSAEVRLVSAVQRAAGEGGAHANDIVGTLAPSSLASQKAAAIPSHGRGRCGQAKCDQRHPLLIWQLRMKGLPGAEVQEATIRHLEWMVQASIHPYAKMMV